ncbi:MAG: macro domain-containing protein [Verrucomicrobiales bacterium]
MKRLIQNIDVLDLTADALIYSTNVLLNCTGGVGACLVARYGEQVQTDLHQLLRQRNIKFADQGAVFQMVTEDMPYKRVFHTIPCDGFYNTTKEIVESVLRVSLRECIQAEVQTVALTALATGYGHLGFDAFFRIAAQVLADPEFAKIQTTTICLDDPIAFDIARDQVLEEELNLAVVL